MKRVGLFGGSFDPVHNAHVALATTALAQLGLDELRWIPVGQPWQKARRLAAAADREAMVRLAIAGEPGNEWFLILGQDQYASLHTWHGWRELLGLVTLAIANRPGAALAVNPQIGKAGHQEVRLPMMDVSSTEVRRRVAAGESIADLVPDTVARYIEQHRLYSAAG
jgi:nicotinate-nucleotide adenylyltransferase